MFAPPAISFKGSGFYSTDAKTKRKEAASGTDGKTGSSEKPKDGAKPADKPAEKKGSAATESSS